MVSVFDIQTKVCGFKPGRGYGFLRVIQICYVPSFGGEVKPEAPCCKVLRHVKVNCKYERNLSKDKFSFLSPVSTAWYQMTAGRITRELSGG
jgi:hypothetical protein